MRIDEGSALTIGGLGESGVLSRVLAELGQAAAAEVGPGDDCAVLNAEGKISITSDTMIEGPDFRLAWHSGYELGWKLAATNLSDVAAMGARPIGLTVSLAAPPETPVDLLSEIARGLDAACRQLAPGAAVVGGDLGRAPVLFAAVTAVGDHDDISPVLRSGAQPGDVVAYAGELGLAGIGLSLLFDRCADASGVAHSHGLEQLKSAYEAPLRAQLSPMPPIALGRAAAVAGATAMMDVSDGLSLDAARLAQASGVSVDFDSALLESGFGEQRGTQVSLGAMLAGGEDHGMLATFPPTAPLPRGFLKIGVVNQANHEGQGGTEGTGITLDRMPYEPRGWDPYTVLPPGS